MGKLISIVAQRFLAGALLGASIGVALAPSLARAGYTATMTSNSTYWSSTTSAPLAVANGTSSAVVYLSHDYNALVTSIVVVRPVYGEQRRTLGTLEVNSAFDATMTPAGEVVVVFEQRATNPTQVLAVVATTSSIWSPVAIDAANGSSASLPRVAPIAGGVTATFVQNVGAARRLFAATRFSGGSFGSASEIADLQTTGAIASAQLDLAGNGSTAIAVFPRAVSANSLTTGAAGVSMRAHAVRWNGNWGAAQQIDSAISTGEVAAASVALNGAGDGIAAVRLASATTSTVLTVRYTGSWVGASTIATGAILDRPRVGIAAGSAFVAFMETVFGRTVLRAARWDGVAWGTPVAVDGPYDTSGFDLAVASDGVAWVVYRGTWIYVNRWDGAAWQGYQGIYMSSSSNGVPSGAVGGTNALIAAWTISQNGVLRADVDVAVSTRTTGGNGGTGAMPPSPGEVDDGPGADAGASGGGSYDAGSNGGAPQGDAGPLVGAAADAGMTPAVPASDAGSQFYAGDAGAAADAGTAAIEGDAGEAPSASAPFDAGTATVSSAKRCTSDASCSSGTTCDLAYGVCVAAATEATANSDSNGNASAFGTGGSAGCACEVGVRGNATLGGAVAVLALLLLFARGRRLARQRVRPRP